jgi:K+/H+ antiporter YhaU regulatory subunit KhtT
MKQFSRKELFAYKFEQTISNGPTSVIKWLALISLFTVLLLGLLILIFGISDNPDGKEGIGFIEGSWQSLMATLDSGTMGGDEGWLFRMVRFAATILGIFIISILIGSISSGIDQKIDDLKRGRSKVIESNHTLILGWSEKIFSIISEIAIANENQKKPCIVILSEKDKIEAEDEIHSKVKDLKNTKIVIRNGDPLDLNDVDIVNPNGAKSIIVLSPDNEKSDMYVIKTVLGITKSPNRFEKTYNIVAEISNEKNMEAAELVGNNEAIFILSSDIISKVAAQTSLQSGLSIVYSELLSFDGDEIYFKHEASLIGKTYQDALFAYKDSAVIGIFTDEQNVLINPDKGYVLKENDEIIAISEDDDTIVLNSSPTANTLPQHVGKESVEIQKDTKTLILGWNLNGIKIIQELDNYTTNNSEIVIVAELNDGDKSEIEQLSKRLNNLSISFSEGEINDKQTLLALNLEKFNNVIVLSYKDLEIQESDAKTLICLLHLRNISLALNKQFNIVTEMLDIKNRALGKVAKADDFIVGDNLISLMISQLSENQNLKSVFDELLKAEGSEIYLKPAARYVSCGTPVTFYTITANALEIGETAIGYRLKKNEEDSDQNFGIKLNPNKEKLIEFSEEDFIIVLSED